MALNCFSPLKNILKSCRILVCIPFFRFLWNLITTHPELTKTTCTRSPWHWSCSVDFYFYYCLVVDLHVQANTSSRHSERQQWQLFILFVIPYSHNREISGHLAKLYLIKSSSAFDSLATWLPAPSTTYAGKGIQSKRGFLGCLQNWGQCNLEWGDSWQCS